MLLLESLKADIAVNIENPKGKIVSVSYRIANFIARRKKNSILIKVAGYPFVKLYRSLFYWWFGIEIPEKTTIGDGLQVWHGFGLVINSEVVIGKNALLRHSTTIGNKYEGSGCPIIGDNVNIGAHTIIIGDIRIGDNVTIGAGSVVTKSIPANSIAYGNPLKIIPKQSVILK